MEEFRRGFVKPDLLSERLADWIRGEIVAGHLKPGERLVEQALSKEYQVSRVPLREALRIVAADGLVTLSPHRGATVTSLSDTELVELFGLRMAVEGFAAGEAAKRRASKEIPLLRLLLEEMSESVAADELDHYHALAAKFHSGLVAAGGNKLLSETYDRVTIRFRRYQAAMARIPELPEKSLEEHAGILDAVERGDHVQARALSEEHIAGLVERFRGAACAAFSVGK
jgi:DNA-binding GntR family transcriptional regulator